METSTLQQGNAYGFYPCPCCGYHTLAAPADNTFELCSVCFWEDDGVQLHDLSYEGGANQVSLAQARNNFLQFGACEQRFQQHVRAPSPQELP